MKRYLYILLGALAVVGCKPQPTPAPEPVVEYHFGTMSAETSANSATITANIPTITIDGVEDKSAIFSLGYYEEGLLFSDRTIVEEYTTEGGKAIFAIEGLKPNTQYTALLSLRSATAEERESEPITFRTAEHTPKCEINFNAEVDAKGIMATIALSDVEYLVDGAAQEIKSVELEYRLSNSAWTKADATDKASIRIPTDGREWLEESSDYIYRITITPEGDYEPITSAESAFKTRYAEVTANISKPEVAIVDEKIDIEVESVEVLFDGVEINDYKYLDYYIYYREADTENWTTTKCEPQGDKLALTLDVASFSEGLSYEFAGAVEAGAEHKLYLSEVATLSIPKSEEPTPPTPPTPPISGDADTSDLAGSWHLTKWRGAEPSFDVYLSISEDGVVTLWQRIESREWELFISVVGFENGIISGEYSDGVAWSTSYSVALGDNTMTWIDTADSTDISVYTRSELPDTLPSTATATTRSTISERFL